MYELSVKPGTVLRFKGVDGRNVHMGFAFDATRVMELIAGEEYGRYICHVYLTDINAPHPLRMMQPYRDQKPTWLIEENSPNGWSIKNKINRIVQAYEEFEESVYHQINNNCQHFVYQAVAGYRKSPDADDWKWAGWMVGDGGPSASLSRADTLSELSMKYRREAFSAIQAIAMMI